MYASGVGVVGASGSQFVESMPRCREMCRIMVFALHLLGLGHYYLLLAVHVFTTCSLLPASYNGFSQLKAGQHKRGRQDPEH